MEEEADTSRRSILNLSVVTVFGHILTYGTFNLFNCRLFRAEVDIAHHVQ